MKKSYTFDAKVWLYPGDAAWHFATLPVETAHDIDHHFALVKRGWGSLPVLVTLGKTSWKTSIFPDKKSDSYLLPLKAQVRQKEGVVAGKTVALTIEISE
jgi:hypothetical protein